MISISHYKKPLPLLIGLCLAGMVELHSQPESMLVTVEPVGVYNSTLNNVSVDSFSGYAIPAAGTTVDYKNQTWMNGKTPIGIIDHFSLEANNLDGGTPNTSVIPFQSTLHYSTTTLSLNSPSSYFGLYWSAADRYNNLSFYNGNQLVGTVSTASLMSLLPKSYFGNPDPVFAHKDTSEDFAFVNFFASSSETFNKVVFQNTGTSGFESQDWTVRVGAYNPQLDGVIPGTPVAAFTTQNGVTTTSKITDVAFNGSALTYKDNSGKTVNFQTVSKPSGAAWTSYGFSANGKSLGVVRNPEPSVYLTFAMLGIIVIFASRKTTALRIA